MQNPPPNQQGKSGIGLDANIAAALGYIVGILALILFFVEKENRFVRFHAIQSVIYSVAMVVLMIVLGILSTIVTIVLANISSSLAFVGLLFYLLFLLLWLAWFGGLIYAAVKAYQGQMFKLPLVGNMAENIANK
jgi:uncharacterized membrane protein